MSAVGCRMRAFCVAGGEELLAVSSSEVLGGYSLCDQRSVSFAAEKGIFGRTDRRIVMRSRSFLSTMTPAFQTEKESFSWPLNSRYQVYEIGIMSVEKFLLGMDSSQDRNLVCWNWRIPLLFLLVSASQLRARTRTMKSKGCRPRTSRKEKTVSLEGVMESRMKSFISLVGTAGQACFSAVKAGVSGLTKATEK
ncbi:hypothetical protein NC652_032993 [Populus alba x Populus x berolinensis]|nr:hypothetical protein NC652_032993 [Populus alba x Populus x berolinensis]